MVVSWGQRGRRGAFYVKETHDAGARHPRSNGSVGLTVSPTASASPALPSAPERQTHWQSASECQPRNGVARARRTRSPLRVVRLRMKETVPETGDQARTLPPPYGGY